MWPSVTVVPAGNPVRFATKVTLAAVTLPPLVVVSKVMVAVPVPDDSALVIGGTSFDGRSAAVKVGLVGVPDGDVDVLDGDVELPQPAAMNASAISAVASRFMVSCLLPRPRIDRTCAYLFWNSMRTDRLPRRVTV